jgi:CPA1 family monovalent cation:H+ antiporter
VAVLESSRVVDFSHDDALVLLAVLAAAVAMLAAAPALGVPYPILLVVGGLALGFVPGLPDLELPPDLVLVAVLPPLLYSAAFFTSLRELRANVRPISLLAIGLVLATTVGVAAVAHSLVGLSWPAAFVLGAIVSPTDPIAATSIAQRLGIPRRIVTIVEGESLINDGTALVAYRFAVAAVVTGSFTLWEAGLRFAGNVAGGIAIGLAVGYLVRQARRRLDNPPVEITISLMTGYLAYLPAEAAGVSGVLAAVTVGIYVGWYAPELGSPQQRLQGYAVWEIVIFLLNALLFILIGLQLPLILEALEGTSTTALLGYAAAVSGAVIAIRFLWVFPATYLPRWASRRVRERDPAPPWQYPAAVSWMGMRGAVSLAAALALPYLTDAGAPFDARDLIVFLTFSVILVTLVFQGLSLPLVIRLLGLEEDEQTAREEAKARKYAAHAALARLEELFEEEWVQEETAERLRGLYAFRRARFQARLDGGDDRRLDERSAAYQRLRRELLEAERRAVVELRRTGRIDDEAMHRIQRDLDLEDVRLEI